MINATSRKKTTVRTLYNTHHRSKTSSSYLHLFALHTRIILVYFCDRAMRFFVYKYKYRRREREREKRDARLIDCSFACKLFNALMHLFLFLSLACNLDYLVRKYCPRFFFYKIWPYIQFRCVKLCRFWGYRGFYWIVWAFEKTILTGKVYCISCM